jgi:hypothetical protein
MTPVVSLLPFNAYNQDNLQFAYEIMEYRWSKHNSINIKHKTTESMPNWNEVECIFQSEKIKHIYSIYLGRKRVGIIFVDIDDNVSEFLLPKYLKEALKQLQDEHVDYKPKSLSADIHLTFYKKHPEIKHYYASVNPENKLSLNALIKNGYEPIEIVLAMTTEKGVPTQGPWKPLE